MQKMIILIGPPAAGKSYVASNPENPANFKSQGYLIFSSDEYREKLTGDVNNQDKNFLVFKILHNDMFKAINEGKNVVYDACNTKLSDRRRLFKMIEERCERKPDVIGIVFTTSLEKCIEQNQDPKRGRIVPVEAIERMLNQLEKNPPSLEEGFSAIYTREEWLKGMSLDEKIKNNTLAKNQENEETNISKEK